MARDQLGPSRKLDPTDPFKHPKFPWATYLQRHLTRRSVNVSDLHPIMGLRLAALFIELTQAGLGDDRPGLGAVQIMSGVRSRAQQVAIYNDVCLRQRRCGFVAHPTAIGGVDVEGVQRQGSNHQAQRQHWTDLRTGKLAEVGYAVDLYNARGRDDAAWAPIHDRLERWGLDWPLKSGAVERWHIEWFPRHLPGPYRGPWPERPGVHRPLVLGAVGGDVADLQRQTGARKVDGVFGRSTEAAVKRLEARLGLDPNGVWSEANQERFEETKARRPRSTPPAPRQQPEPAGAGPVVVIPAADQVAALQAKVVELEADLVRARRKLRRLAAAIAD